MDSITSSWRILQSGTDQTAHVRIFSGRFGCLLTLTASLPHCAARVSATVLSWLSIFISVQCLQFPSELHIVFAQNYNCMHIVYRIYRINGVTWQFLNSNAHMRFFSPLLQLFYMSLHCIGFFRVKTILTFENRVKSLIRVGPGSERARLKKA